MNIGIDIDDTITDTSEFLIPYVANYFSLDIEYLKNNNIFYNNLPKEYRNKQTEFGKVLLGTLLYNIVVMPNGKEMTIWNIAVKEDFRNQGIATKLMEKAEKIADRNKAFVKSINEKKQIGSFHLQIYKIT